MSRPNTAKDTEPTGSDEFEALLAASSLGTEAARHIASTVPTSVRAHLLAHVTKPDQCAECAGWQEPADPSGPPKTNVRYLADIIAAASTGATHGTQTHAADTGTPKCDDAITDVIALKLRVSPDSTLPFAAQFRYHLRDPFAVHVEFHVGQDETVNWTFSRNLLTTGLHQRVGKGDVRVWPTRQNRRHIICIALSSPEGDALLEAPRQQVIEFLRRTKELVPLGTEASGLDFERFAEDLRANNHEED